MIDYNQEYWIRKAAGTVYGKSQNRKNTVQETLIIPLYGRKCEEMK